MPFIEKYPYTDAHELNLDWIIAQIRKLSDDMTEFEAVNKISFDGTWDITKQYKPWTIVNNGTQGYISIQPVPAGIQLTNEDYWRGVIDYTATIADLQNRVVILEGQTAQLESDLSPLINKKYIFIGDSYNTTDTPAGGVPIVPWSRFLAQFLGLSAGDYYNIGSSGSGFVHGAPFSELLDRVGADITDKNAITDIVVLGGVNDISEDLDDVNAGIQTFVNKVTADYPNAMISMGFISWSLNFNTRNLMMPLIQYWEAASKYPNVKVISNAFKYYHYYPAFYQPDGHPNQTGSAAIARGIANFLKGGANVIHWTAAEENITFDPALNITNGTLTIKFDQVDDMVRTNLYCDSYFRSSGFEMNTELEFTLGTFTVQFARFAKILPVAGQMYVYDGNGFHNVAITLVFDNDKIKIRPLEVTEGGGGGATFSNITLIKLNFNGCFLTPIEYC